MSVVDRVDSITEWPVVPHRSVAGMLAVQYQFEQSQWWSQEEIREYQTRRASEILHHAWDTVPFYRRKLEAAGFSRTDLNDRERWDDVPLLRRVDIQTSEQLMRSTKIPESHGHTSVKMTSGSTGQPVRVLTTESIDFLWCALTVRDHLWHRREYSGLLASIRHVEKETARAPHGAVLSNWGGIHQRNHSHRPLCDSQHQQ